MTELKPCPFCGSKTIKWISVTERLPKLKEKVIAYSTDNGIHFDRLDFDGWIDKCITYWMPLPEPPKETQDGSPN